MGTERRKQLLLGALMVALAVVVYRAVAAPAPSADAATTTAARSTTDARRAPGGTVTAPDVHLESLKVERPKPVETERNLFRFKPKAPPPPPPASMRPTAPVVTVPIAPAAPPGPPPPPAITLKFIGVIEPGAGKPKLAVLSDGQGPPLYGWEGGTVGGRYRILRIGVESIELSYLDGRGRQTIRLTGS
jgi:hypothetical protein